ncbi:hypothetical protein AURDEDRAFT_111510 [Auricularia subglabra TFB-10046 SS5]|nr:hypothetical protein AURDEDRAFT_111510 [Auricularia subglabra TFB-10046 SS5]
MAAPATAHSPRPLKTSSKLSAAFANAFGFGSRAAKHGKQFGHDGRGDPIPQYSLEDDPFAQRYKHSVSPPPALGSSDSALVVGAPSVGRPEFPRSKSDSGQRRERELERELPALPLTPHTATEGAGGSTGNMFQRKRMDSSQYRGKAPSQLLPVGVAHNEPAKKEQARGSWHARSRSSIDMQLPKLARSPRTSDDFSSILDAVANVGTSARPLPSPASDLNNNSSPLPVGPHASNISPSASARARTASTAAPPPARPIPPSSPLPSPPTSPPQVTRARSQTVGETSKKRPGGPLPTSPNTLRKLLPTLPPTQSLPPIPVMKAQQSQLDRPQSSPTNHHPNGNGLLGQPRIHPAAVGRPSTAQGLSVATASQTSPQRERALSPVMPSPTSGLPDANLQRSMSGRSASPGLSPRVSSSESSSLLFAAVPDSDRSESSSVSSNPAVRRVKSPVRPATSDNSYSFPGSGKENHSFARLFSDDASTPRGSISVIDHSRRTSNASTVHAQLQQHSQTPLPPHPLRKSTSQSYLPGATRHRVDSSTSSALSAVTIKSSVWAGSSSQRPDAPKLIRKQRSLHNVAIPPVPRQVVPQPPTPGTSPTNGPSLLSSWSLKRRSGSRARDVDAGLLTLVPSRERERERDDDAPIQLQHVTSVKSARDKANRRPSVTSAGRPPSPAISTFFDDSESAHRSSASHEVSSPKSRRGSGINIRRGSDIIQHIVPPEELASSWGTASASVTDVEAKLGDSSSAPSDSSSRLPSKSMPSSPTRRSRTGQLEAGSNSMPPSRAVSLIGQSRPDDLQLLSTPVGFGGGLALAPMPPRKQQSQSFGRSRGGSLLGEASRQGLLNSLPPPPRGSRRPSLIASSVRSDSALRSHTGGVRGNAALLSAKSRPMSKASTASGGSSIEPATPSGSGPPPVSRKRSILKKPSFLDFENDDAEEFALQRAKQLTPPPLTPTQATPSPPAAIPTPVARQKPPPLPASRYEDNSFLDLGRMSFETSVSSSDDAGPDTISIDQESSSDFRNWGR